MPLDEQGNLVDQTPEASAATAGSGSIAPPGYGEHVLDQLYEDVDVNGFQTPAVHSGVNSPYYSQSRAGSTENLNGLVSGDGITAAALSSRLQTVSLDQSQRNSSFNSISSVTYTTPNPSGPASQSQSSPLTRSSSEEDSGQSGRTSPEHIDFPDLCELNKVPSYATAVRTPARSRVNSGGVALPDYQTALSAPGTPAVPDTPVSDPLSTILEVVSSRSSDRLVTPRTVWPRGMTMDTGSGLYRIHSNESDERRRLHLIQARG
jgi:arrestin-related trafficking adapter 4/5/7